MSKSFMINRRTALGGAAALAAGAALPAHAQDNKRIVVGTWGGDYSRLLAKNIETPLLAPEGWDVVKDEAQAPPRRAKMMAEKALRRGTSDIQGLSANDMYEVNEQGLAEQIDYSKMPNAAEPHPGDEVSLRHRPHLFGQGRALQSQAHGGTDGLRRHARPQARRQARHHRHPVPVHHGGGGPGLGRLGGQLRSRQGAAARLQEGGRAHLSVQRGLRPGAQDRGDRLRHHVEGARRAMAERRHQRLDRGAQGRRADVRLGLHDPEERAQQGRRLRLSRTP